jgi:hypothetical protein
MTDSAAKAAALARVAELVQSFRRNEADHLLANYNETQARTDFITPLLEAFGWDVHNAQRQPLAFREVIEEATVEVGEERLSKKPDYELRLARQRKMFIEAKKPNVRIERDRGPAFQTRRYGYSASLPIAILTNFHLLAIYDCRPAPAEGDEAHVARFLLMRYEEFEARFDELWDILSRDAVYSGAFDKRFAVGVTRQGAQQFDDYFLGQVREWRARLAVDIHANTPGLTPAELTYAVQLFLSRIVFLRICEDRDIEKYETLKNLDRPGTFVALMEMLRRADAFYNSGLFRLLDDERLGIRISDGTLQSIISELYYPQSPYTFAVVETEVLGQIYEQFLGEVITASGGNIEIVSKPEVRDSGGVVPTPRYIVDAIVERTLTPAITGKSPAELAEFTVADTCCGSGIFLLSAFEQLMDQHLTWYLANNRENHVGRTIYDAGAGRWRLTFDEKRRILLAHIRGVDIDANAVEVTRFSLLLKLIEDETASGLQEFVANRRTTALPALDNGIRCGNSLVSRAEWITACGALPTALANKVNPFTWSDEFPTELARGGFDVIVGNPPYIRIQNMTVYSPEEVAYYQSPRSPYSTARQDNFDKYAIFIERSLTLLRPQGRLGVIVPHKFMTIHAGRTLRRLISTGRLLEDVVHFGVKQVFGPGTSNYTCILIMDRRGCDPAHFEQAGPLEAWRYTRSGTVTRIPAVELTEEPWQFADAETRALFDRVRAAVPNQLDALAEILVGVQTSADNVYIIHPVDETPTTITCRWNELDWPIERGILRPCLHDAPLASYTRPVANAWIIFPYDLAANHSHRVRANLIQPAEFARRFPRCWAYLSARRVELDDRNITGGAAASQQWYQYGRSQSLTKFDTPKIILPVLSTEPRYSYDDTNMMFTGGGNGPYYMVRPRPGAHISNQYLLAVLNHPLSEAFIRKNTSTFRGGYYSHGKQFIEVLPVPVPPDAERVAIEELVTALIDALAAAANARTPHERTLQVRAAADVKYQIEARVSAVFGLSEADIDVIRAVPIPD